MIPLHEQYVTDNKGNRTAVVIDIREYERLKEYMEDLEDAQDLIKARESGKDIIALDDWRRELNSAGRI